jgi:hypothetical protein
MNRGRTGIILLFAAAVILFGLWKLGYVTALL